MARGDAERVGEGGEIRGVEFNAGGAGGRWDGGVTATALVVEDQLSCGCKWCECGPQEAVIEDQAAVDANERQGAVLWILCGKYGEL